VNDIKQRSSLMSRCAVALIGAVLLACAYPSARAQAYDAAADFVPGENAANAWTWGWKYPAGGFTAMVPIEHDRCGIYLDGQGPIPGFDCFSAWDSGWTIPQVLKNNSGASVMFKPAGGNPSLMTLGQYALFLRLGIDPNGIQMHPVVRYTAPADGSYDFLVSAQLIDKAAVGAIVHMTGQPVKQLDGFGAGRHFQPTYQLRAGESVDLWVTPIGSVFYATTAVRVSVMKR